ncbi:DUF4932 domain-containing protein [Galbibacter mesophilus]|uniref:DUF4932 domain-containing protein n=1 Tax=Galbibacter mesophilus TaxID=379069 RepID=UPI00191E2FD3|nr:DUF4932 domain-containing protein [Galbibacter mesophilus]MCM5663815.1 DUF4932 domain-containing protein [Galbibacter mesophilus]
MKIQLKYFLLILIMTSCSTTRNWQSEQNDNTLYATFEEFNGKENIKIKEDSSQIAYLSYFTNTTSGNISLEVNRDNFKFYPNKTIHLKTDLNTPLYVKITGEAAKGEFKLEYPTYKRPKIQVLYNSNFELLSLAFFLSNMYQNLKENESTFDYEGRKVKVKELYGLNLKIAEKFKNFQTSESLKVLDEFFQKRWYLDYTKYVLNLPELPNSSFRQESLDFQDVFESIEEERRFFTALRGFYKEINFDVFLEEYQPFYDKMIQEVNNNLPEEDFITEMEHLYAKKANGYFLNASLTMPFSQGFAITKSDRIGYVFGSLTLPLEINDLNNLKLGYSNSSELRNISVHEFGHSFVNPVIDKIEDSLIDDKKHLFEPIKEKMSEQAYSSWKITLYEHFVRAGEIFIAEQLGDYETATKLSKDYIEKRQFIYLKQIIPAMRNWYNEEYFSKSYSNFVKETIENLKFES